ncbi:unnamed protein product, partial [marine sediment metagenome]
YVGVIIILTSELILEVIFQEKTRILFIPFYILS